MAEKRLRVVNMIPSTTTSNSSTVSVSRLPRSKDLPSSIDSSQTDSISTRRSSGLESQLSKRSNSVRMTAYIGGMTPTKRSNKASLDKNTKKRLSPACLPNELESTIENNVSEELTNFPLAATSKKNEVQDTVNMTTSGKKSRSFNSVGLPMSLRSNQRDLISSRKSSQVDSSLFTRSRSVNMTSSSPGLTSKGSNKDVNARKLSLVHGNITNELVTTSENIMPEKLTSIPDRSERVINTMTSGETMSIIKSKSAPSSIPLSSRTSQRDLILSRRSSQIESSLSRRSNSTRMKTLDRDLTTTVRVSKECNKPILDENASKRSIANVSIPNELETSRGNTELEKLTRMTSGEDLSKENLESKSASSSSIGLPLSLRSSQLDNVSSRRSSQIESSQSSRQGNATIKMTSSISSLTSPIRGSKSSDKASLDRKASKRSLVSTNLTNKFGTTSEHSLPEELEIFADRCNNIEKTAMQNIKKVKQSHSAVTAEIKKYRKQVNKVLDMWEKEALERVDDIMRCDLAHLKSVLDECVKLQEEILQSAKETTGYKTKLLEVNVIETEAKNTYREYKFISNDNISNLVKGETRIGEVKITHEVAGLYNNLNEFEKFVPTYLEEINVKAESDAFDCDITGMSMIGMNRLVVADANNKSIKCIDTTLKKITSRLKFSSGPWDLTMVNRGRVAVTIPSEKIIQFVLITPDLVSDRYLKVNGECHGIAYRQECLIVSFRSPGKVQIMSLKGNVLKTINQFIHRTKRYVFHWPDYIAVNKDDNSFYVSDWHRNTVTCLSWKGEVTGVFTDRGTKMAGVAVANDGSVFVCKRTSHSIVKLNPDCTVSNTILEEKHGLKFPWSLCFCDEESKLYVDNNRNSNTVAVFELR